MPEVRPPWPVPLLQRLLGYVLVVLATDLSVRTLHCHIFLVLFLYVLFVAYICIRVVVFACSSERSVHYEVILAFLQRSSLARRTLLEEAISVEEIARKHGTSFVKS